MSEDLEICQCEMEVAFAPKPPIKCLHTRDHVGDPEWTKAKLIFTHGAGGTLKADAIVNFTHGFVTTSTSATLLCFQGNMNLASRVKMFKAIIEARESNIKHLGGAIPACLGGRSMGARAAVMAAPEETAHLVLVSYPLHTGKETRDQILFNLPSSVKVIFVSGDNDSMCNLKRLQLVRQKMRCKTWTVVVRDADHGMNVKPKIGTRDVGRMAGAIVAAWLHDSNERLTEGVISWDTDKAAAQWSGWSESSDLPEVAAKTTSARPVEPVAKSAMSRMGIEAKHDTEVNQARPRKRRKR